MSDKACKRCNSPGPFYARRRTLPSGEVRIEESARCKECEKAYERARYQARRPSHPTSTPAPEALSYKERVLRRAQEIIDRS